MLSGAALDLEIAILQYRWVGPGPAKVQRNGYRVGIYSPGGVGISLAGRGLRSAPFPLGR
jgi:hypothetical protein